MTYIECSSELAGALQGILWQVFQHDEGADFDDLHAAVATLRPSWKGLVIVAAWRHIKRRAWLDGLRVLVDAESGAQRSPMNHALSALCLFGLDDVAWQSHASAAAAQRDDARAAKIARRLLSRAANAPDGAGGTPADADDSAAGADSGSAPARAGVVPFIAPVTWVRA